MESHAVAAITPQTLNNQWPEPDNEPWPRVIHARLDQFTPLRSDFSDALSADEVKRAQAFRFEKDALGFVLRRGLLRRLLSRFIDSSPGDLRIGTLEHGKPVLTDDPGLHFSVSHSAGNVLFAFSRASPVGIDVEQHRTIDVNTDIEGMARIVFSEQDVTRIQAADGAEQVERFFRTWTRMESLVKAIGTGLAAQRDIPCLALPNNPLNVTTADGNWQVCDLCMKSDVSAAITTARCPS